MKTITIVHTSLVSHTYLNNLCRDIIPEARVYNIVDDSLLQEVSSVGHETPGIINRLCKYFQAAEQLGTDLIINQCSSVGIAAAIAAKTVCTPVLRIDDAMAEEAVRLGGKIAVIATVASTVTPSCQIIEEKAAELGQQVEIVPYLVDGAMWALIHEGQEKHNQLVKSTVLQAAEECDVIVLAQGSMVVLLSELTDIKKPILSSPVLAVQKARRLLLEETES